ncbi:MAG: Methylthioribulose-1-phosphate dehydratase [Alyxoria varia]|nr:MAG: Methylthioribulose-1-phosphate dehydratase [Alyxoria varia]
MKEETTDSDALVRSDDPLHPANHIPTLCAHFYSLGWVTGTGGGASICTSDHVYLAPSGVQKELIKPTDIFILPASTAQHDYSNKSKRISHHDLDYLRRPPNLTPSACTPLFMTAFRLRNAGCCIHTHSQWAVLATLLLDRRGHTNKPMYNDPNVFSISFIEQIKGIPRGPDKEGNLGFEDTLRIPIIENTSKEEDLTEALQNAMIQWPDTYAVLVRRHGIYVWGDNVAQAKTICESLDYLFQLAVEMAKHDIPWVKDRYGEEPTT